MGERNIVKKYTNGELTVIWQPKKCIHAAECVKRLPQVYKPDEKPWINAENASIEELKDQINACPSGALSYEMEGETSNDENSDVVNTKVEIMENGPLLVHGSIEVKAIDGEKEMKSRTTAFCRCGASQNKPYCDGTHSQTEFKG